MRSESTRNEQKAQISREGHVDVQSLLDYFRYVDVPVISYSGTIRLWKLSCDINQRTSSLHQFAHVALWVMQHETLPHHHHHHHDVN